jgi:hypothetical protein
MSLRSTSSVTAASSVSSLGAVDPPVSHAVTSTRSPAWVEVAAPAGSDAAHCWSASAISLVSALVSPVNATRTHS